MNDWERRRKLEDALRDAVRDREPSPAERRTGGRGSTKRRPFLSVVVLLLGWATIAWIWLARPAFLFGPGESPPPAAEMEEASLRFSLYLERRRVDAYQGARGLLPTTLAEAGPVEDGVTYTRSGSGFTLTGRRGGLTLRLNHAMDADSFLGRSLEILDR